MRLFTDAEAMLADNFSALEGEDIFVAALTALQKANQSQSFGLCKTCTNFTKTKTEFFCELTQEPLSAQDSEKMCQEHIPH